MSVYNLEFNKDDSVLRAIIVALLAELDDSITYHNTYDQFHHRKTVPFYYSATGDERFLLDNFLHDAVSDPNDEKAIGIYNPIPRGVMNMTSMEIDAGSLVNKFTRTEILKLSEGMLKPFSYETMLVPIILSFECTVLCNSHIEIFKITESIISSMYKNNIFHVDLGGYRIPSNYTIPESLDSEKLFEYSFGDKKENRILFTIEVQSYIPVFDENTEMFAGNVVEGFELGIKDYYFVESETNPDDYEGLTPRGPQEPIAPVEAEAEDYDKFDAGQQINPPGGDGPPNIGPEQIGTSSTAEDETDTNYDEDRTNRGARSPGYNSPAVYGDESYIK